MSGGHFDLYQFNFESAAEEINKIVKLNNSNDKNEYGDKVGYQFDDKTIELFANTSELLIQVSVMLHGVDYLVSGDSSEDSFKEDLAVQLRGVKGGSELLEKLGL